MAILTVVGALALSVFGKLLADEIQGVPSEDLRCDDSMRSIAGYFRFNASDTSNSGVAT